MTTKKKGAEAVASSTVEFPELPDVATATTEMEDAPLSDEQVSIIVNMAIECADTDSENGNNEAHDAAYRDLPAEGLGKFGEIYDLERKRHAENNERVDAALNAYEAAYFAVIGKEEELKRAREHFLDLGTNLVPETLSIAGKKSGVLPGSQLPVILEDQIHVGVTKGNRAEAIDWLVRNGHEALLKYEFTVSFGLKEDERAKAFARMVKALLPAYNLRVVADHTCQSVSNAVRELMKESFPERKLGIELSIPGPTLKKFVTTNLRNGVPLPEMFGTHIRNFAAIQVPKAEKKVDFGEGAEDL